MTQPQTNQKDETPDNEKSGEAEKEEDGESGSDKNGEQSTRKSGETANDRGVGPDVKIDSVEKYQKEKTLSEYKKNFCFDLFSISRYCKISDKVC